MSGAGDRAGGASGGEAAEDALDCFVLCGGRSRRMGEDKALLTLGGRPLIGRVIDAACGLGGRVALVTDRPEPYARFGLETFPDRWPDCGALGGIGTAVWKAHTERALVLACDLPFLTTPFLAWLSRLDPGADVTVCATEREGLHPLAAVYGKRCLQAIGRRIGAGKLKVASFFDEVVVRAVGEAELSAHGFGARLLDNLNTPADLARARAEG